MGVSMRLLLFALAALAAAQPPAPRIDAAFPGGNIIVESIDGDRVALRQDLRDTQGHWFYWAFRVRDAGGRRLTFRFTNGNVIGVRGPAVSLDEGLHWSWLGAGSVQSAAFTYAFPPDAASVRFAMAIPYQQADLERFLARAASRRYLRADTLCRSRKGRSVELLHAGALSGRSRYRVLLTARHHSCESLASYVLEGLLDAVASGAEGGWLRRNVEFLAVPFLDKDGVEDGDQGKNRRPRDHNRDYAGESLYPEVRALRELAPRWSAGKLRVALDLHCPTLRGPENESIYFVGTPNAKVWEHLLRLSSLLERTQRGPLRFDPAANMPFGKSWNTAANTGANKSFAMWAGELPGIEVANTLEVAYASAHGRQVDAASARALGADLAGALRAYLDLHNPATVSP
jgi:hypothetical protein